MAEHNAIGSLGEDIAAQWLESKGFAVAQRNYRQKWGEIDLIAQSSSTVHFIEVKSVSYGTRTKLNTSISHDTWRPEEMVHRDKLHKLGKTIETWLMEYQYTGDWQIDVITVRMVPHEKFAKVKYIENIVLEL